MIDTFTNKTVTDISTASVQNENLQFVQDVLYGLSHQQKCLSSKYFYDEEGSRIFQEIMQLEEYYLTKSETAILSARKQTLLDLMEQQQVFSLIDLGSGDGVKTNILLHHFHQMEADFTYFPVDISHSILDTQVNALSNSLPDLKVNALVAEYYDALGWLKNQDIGRKLVLLLGSNIGNFSYEDTLRFLQTLWYLLDDKDMLLIGFDLKKNPETILQAYNDSKGVTARFNLNLLKRINRELGGNFDINNFSHYATYDPVSGACKSYLLSLQDQSVWIEKLNKSFSFKAWEPIHMEYSFKYSFCDINKLAEESGFTVVKNLTDKGLTFVDSVWKVNK